MVCPTTERAKLLRKRFRAWGALFSSRPDATVGLCGIGVLTDGHKMDSGNREFLVVAEPLAELRSLCSQYTPEQFCPVFDIVNRLYAIQSEHISAKDLMRIQTLTRSINNHTLTMNEEHLRRIGTMVVIAGSAEKSAAIRQVLQDYNVRLLCTDVGAAQHILHPKVYTSRGSSAQSQGKRSHATSRRAPKKA